MNAAELRALLEGVADDAKVGVECNACLSDLQITGGSVIASDCVGGELGTDPEFESTVAVVLSESETPDETG